MTLLIALIIAGGIASSLAMAINHNIKRTLGGEPKDISTTLEELLEGCNPDAISVNTDTGILNKIVSIHQSQAQQNSLIEKEVQATLQAAKEGDLNQRIDTEDKEGFYKTLSENINELLNTSQNVIEDTGKVFNAMSKGDLNHTIDNDYAGYFEQLKQDANSTIDQLTRTIEGDIKNYLCCRGR